MARNYYIFKNGRIKRSENTLVLETTEGKKFIPINDVDQIFVFGEVDFNSSFINLVSQSKITVHFFNYYGYYTGSFIPRETNVSGYLILKQVEHYIDKDKRIKLASSFVESACHNMKRNLEKREGFDNEIEKITEYMERIKDAPDITSLMSIEAHVRKIYYGCIEKLTEWEFDIRTIRPPKNPLNAMISFGNSLLYAQILKQIYETPLNPTISYLHEPSERRFSLALDVSEIFKPILVDRLILKLINTKIITEQHFEKTLEYAYLKEDARKTFVKFFDETIEETILHRKLKRKVKYKTLITLELYKLIKHLLDEKKFVPLKVWW